MSSLLDAARPYRNKRKETLFLRLTWSLIVCLCALTFVSAAYAGTPTVTRVAGVNLSPEGSRIAGLVQEFFPDAPIMIHVANCESVGLQHWSNTARRQLRPHDSCRYGKCASTSAGVFQILIGLHGPMIRQAGLNMHNERHYMRFARQLYDERGTQPWNASKYCWGPFERNPARAIS